jgi:zinc transporter ZupT
LQKIDDFSDKMSMAGILAAAEESTGSQVTKRRQGSSTQSGSIPSKKEEKELRQQAEKWKRILLLVIAVTVHNIPEGLCCHLLVGRSSHWVKDVSHFSRVHQVWLWE